MNREVVVVAAAAHELTEAVDWYEARRPGLGGRLLDEVAVALQSIAEGFNGSPYMGDEGAGETRLVLLRRFPRGVLFVCVGVRVEVLTVADLRRRPGYWRGR